jgi:predicted DNA-binding transcriptional regulator AlpA
MGVKFFKRGRHYLTGPQVRQRYGGRSEMWLWRRDKFDPDFPKPIKFSPAGMKLYDEAELDAYDESRRKASANVEVCA